MVTDSELNMLEEICHQSSAGVWRDFPARGRGYRTHIGYPVIRKDDEEIVNIPIFETNTNAKRGDVLFVVYAHEYMLKLVEEIKALRSAQQAAVVDAPCSQCGNVGTIERSGIKQCDACGYPAHG